MCRSAKRRLIRAMQCRAARIAASASATRHQGKGAAKAAREHLSQCDVRRFAVSMPSLFLERLNHAADELAGALPPRARSWGLARKLLNIFLRDVLYTTYFSSQFRFIKLEPFLEIPLDSITARHLRACAGPRVLPRWRGVKHLTKEINERYQRYAIAVAANRGLRASISIRFGGANAERCPIHREREDHADREWKTAIRQRAR